MEEKIKSLFEKSIKLKEECINQGFGSLIKMGDTIVESIINGGKLMLCGNGGSAADAQHLAAELVVRLRPRTIAEVFLLSHLLWILHHYCMW